MVGPGKARDPRVAAWLISRLDFPSLGRQGAAVMSGGMIQPEIAARENVFIQRTSILFHPCIKSSRCEPFRLRSLGECADI